MWGTKGLRSSRRRVYQNQARGGENYSENLRQTSFFLTDRLIWMEEEARNVYRCRLMGTLVIWFSFVPGVDGLAGAGASQHDSRKNL